MDNNIIPKKNSLFLYFVGWMIFALACGQQVKQPFDSDSTGHKENALDSNSGGNMVKVEAPDADTKIAQGYALPRFNERTSQSPINILSDSTLIDSSRAMEIKLNDELSEVENLGHTIQLDFKEGTKTLLGGKTYISKQFHFHTPSEHLIDGITYPMEMHIVNVLQDTAGASPKYLVIAVLFKMGHENQFLNEFLNKIPHEEGKDTLNTGIVKFEDLFSKVPRDQQGYFSYNGSLTTPPYSETVDWIIKKYVMEASPGQIYAIEKLEGENARHVQASYARKIFSK
jgi:carbonic anhydrase